MRKIRIIFTLVVAFALGFTLLSGVQPINLEAAVPTNVGVIDETVPDWVQGHEASVQQKFADAYEDADFTETPADFVNSVSFGAHKRVALIQKIGSEGAILLNEIDGTPFVITDEDALTELEFLLAQTDNNQNGILMDIVESSGSTYYVTDRRNLDGIFRLVEDPLNPGTFTPEYLDLRVGIGTGTYADIMWIEYTKAYKLAAQFMEPLGLPLTAVARYRYTTPNLNNNGTYVLDNGNKVLSEKDYTKQQFENGWIIQARMQILTNPETGTLGGHQKVSHAAAPIMNDMYTLVTAMAGNSDLSVTGAPVSLEFNVEGVRYQNFEYGHVKVESGVATFVPDLVVDSLGTAMNRRIGITLTWDNIRTGHADNNPVHGLGWERLRVSQNYRDTVGELIRDGILPGPLADNQIVHSGVKAPADGTWFSFNVGKNPDGTNATSLGAANFFIYHTSWYKDAYPLLPYLNTGQFVDAADGLGRPIDVYKNIYNVYYQEFKGGIGYRDMKPGSTPVRVLAADMTTWLDGAESIEAALLAKGIAKATHAVTFNDHDGTAVSTVNVAHGTSATAPSGPTRLHYTFESWSPNFSNVLYDLTVTAQYSPVEYDITYVLDGGTNHVDNLTTANIETVFELLPAVKDGFFFEGWYEDADFVTPITYLEAITEQKTIYAKFGEIKTAEEMVGVFASAAPAWVNGNEALVQAEFMRVYTQENFVNVPNEYVQSIDFGKGRISLYQIVPGEGAIFLNEIEGKALVVTDPVALAEIQALLTKTNEFEKAYLLDIVVSGGETYYVTESRDTNGIFKVIDDPANPGTNIVERLELRVGVGAADYGDVTFVAYTKAYKLAAQYMESLGLPITAVTRQRYTTADMTSNGRYIIVNNVISTSEKEHTAQQFENGWIIQARIRTLNVETGALGGNQAVQHGAAPILNDMYALVIALENNATLNVTGAPVSIEFTHNGIRYQNFEYGYVKVESGVATFILDKVVDELGTEMSRMIGAHENFNNMLGADYNIVWENLRVGQNIRNAVGELIRSGVAITDPVHTAHEDGGNMLVQKFDVPNRRLHIIQGNWWLDAFEIGVSFDHHTQPISFWQNKSVFGAPIGSQTTYLNVVYQEFEKAFVYKDLSQGSDKVAAVLYTDLATWLDGAADIEAALLAKGIAETHHDVSFYDHEGVLLQTVNVAHGTAAVAPDAPERAGYQFSKWSVAFDNVTSDITVTAQYTAIEYDVTYVLDGGTNHVDNPAVATVVSNIELKAAEKTDYIFIGWYLDAEFTQPITKLVAVDADLTIYAYFTTEIAADQIVGAFAPGTSPDWVKGHEAAVKAEFDRVYGLAEFVEIPEQFVQSVQLNRTRVMLYQIIPNEGAIVMNEVDGKAFFTKNFDGITAYLASLGTENESVLLGIITVGEVEYFVTDLGIFYFEANVMKTYEFQIGVGPELAVFHDLGADFETEVVLNDFSIAYKFAENYMVSLGLPTSAVTMYDYTTIDLVAGTGLPVSPASSSAKQYYMQSFENGYIMMNSHGENIQYGAASIQKDFYDLVKAINGNADFSKTGTPVSIEMDIDGVRHQNFEFGYVKIVDGVAEFVEGWVVDSQGYELNRRVGTPLRFINWHWGTKNRDMYLVGWERLRITQNFRNATGDLFRAGITPYRVTEADPYGDSGIHDLTSRAGGSSGLWHIFKHAEGYPALGWGNVFLLQGYWYNQPHALDPLFNVGAIVDDAGMGRPLADSQELYNATYQIFETGIAFFNGVPVDGQPNWTVVSGEDFITWMGANETVEDALEAHGIAEAKHTVTWYAQDGVTVLKTEEVNHGDPATPPTAPEIDGFVFSNWSPEGFDSILLPDRKFVAIYGSETGLPQEGKYKFINFDSDGETASFWYENETNIIEVNATLFKAFRASKLTMAESIAVNGLPIYADDNNLITTLFHFQIDESDNTVVNKLNTIGYLDETVTELQNVNVKVALDGAKKLIIQDSFGDAYIFTWDRGGHLLGLPLGAARIERLYPNASNQNEFIDIIVQEFEHGFIMQEVYDNAAYSIYGKSYDEWLVLGGLNGNDSLGVPTSRPYEYEGVIYQNFKYGYIKIDGETVTPTYTESVQVDFKGRPIHKDAGRTENRNNAKIGHAEFEGEILRIYESYMQLYTDMKDQGLMFDHAIELVHEWNGVGLTQGFNPSLSTANVWGQANFTVVIMQTPYTPAVLVKDDILVQYALLDGNKTFGFPVANSFKVDITVEHEGDDVELSVTFQNFTAGYIRTYLVGDIYVLEYYRDAEISDLGVHMVDGVAADTPEWDLSGLIEGPGIDKAELQNKLAALEAERAKVKELVGDIKDLPSNQLFASKALLDEVDAKILEIEALIADEDATNAEITQALVELDALLTKLKNQSAPGQGDPVTEPGEGDGFPTWAIVVLSIVGGLIVLGAAGFVVYTFVIKKKK